MKILQIIPAAPGWFPQFTVLQADGTVRVETGPDPIVGFAVVLRRAKSRRTARRKLVPLINFEAEGIRPATRAPGFAGVVWRPNGMPENTR